MYAYPDGAACTGCSLPLASTPDLIPTVLEFCQHFWHVGCLKLAMVKLRRLITQGMTTTIHCILAGTDDKADNNINSNLHESLLRELRHECIQSPHCREMWPVDFPLFFDWETPPIATDSEWASSWKAIILHRRAHLGFPAMSNAEWSHG